jgi:UDP-N-acetylmuramoylalanine--D-glutamate ligase
VSEWTGQRVVVAGFGRAGFAATDNLLHLGATVSAHDLPLDDDDPLEAERAEKAELLEVLGATILLEEDALDTLPAAVDLVIASPERLDAPLVAQARERGVPVWGEVELAWRLREAVAGRRPAPWLVVAGSAGQGEVALLVEQMLLVASQKVAVAGVAGLPLVEAVMDPESYDALVVALDDAQLVDVTSMSALAAAVLDGGGDAGVRAAAYEHVQEACIYVAADEATRELVEEADVVEGARAIGVTLGMPGIGMLGVVEDLLVERAFLPQRSTSAAELTSLEELGTEDPATVTRSLVAAALALSAGATPVAVRDGLRNARHA